MKALRNSLKAGLVGWLILVGGGCGVFDRPEPVRQNYNFALRVPGLPPVGDGAVLAVAYFDCEPQFATGEFVYRVGEFAWESDYYHQFLDAPASLVTEVTRRWLGGSGRFREVGMPGLVGGVDGRLEGRLLALYGDFRPGVEPAAVIRLQFSLLGPKGRGEILWSRVIERRVVLQSRTPQALMEAWDRGLEQILSEVVDGVGKSVSPGGGAVGSPSAR
jgi:cholesterol transport system auxiliary component